MNRSTGRHDENALGSTVPSIWNVPLARNPHFTGRQAVLQELAAELSGNKMAVVTQARAGLDGVGKTQLALEYVFRHRGDYELVWWVHAEQATSLAAGLAALAGPLELLEREVPDQWRQIDAVRRRLGQTDGWLLAFDDAEGPRDLAPYLPAGNMGHVLITSRGQGWEGTAKPVEVGEFEPEEAVEFLLERTGQSDRKAADALAEELGFFPLALEQAAATMKAADMRLEAYTELYRQRRSELLALPSEPAGHAVAVAVTWEISLQRVASGCPLAADLLNLCAFLAPHEIPKTLLSADHDPGELEKAIAALECYSLAQASEDGLSVHRLAQEMTRRRLTREERQRWAGVALDRLAQVLACAEGDVVPWARPGQLLAHAQAAVEQAEALGIETDATSRLLREVGLYLHHVRELAGARRYCERALAIDERVYGLDHPRAATAVSNLGGVLRAQGDLAGARACCERALAIDERVYGADDPSVATRINNLGTILQDQGDLAGAQACYERALTIDERVYGADDPSVARGLFNLGSALQAQGDVAGAKECFERALIIVTRGLG